MLSVGRPRVASARVREASRRARPPSPTPATSCRRWKSLKYDRLSTPVPLRHEAEGASMRELVRLSSTRLVPPQHEAAGASLVRVAVALSNGETPGYQSGDNIWLLEVILSMPGRRRTRRHDLPGDGEPPSPSGSSQTSAQSRDGQVPYDPRKRRGSRRNRSFSVSCGAHPSMSERKQRVSACHHDPQEIRHGVVSPGAPLYVCDVSGLAGPSPHTFFSGGVRRKSWTHG